MTRFAEIMPDVWVNPDHVVSVAFGTDDDGRDGRTLVTTADGREWSTSRRLSSVLSMLVSGS